MNMREIRVGLGLSLDDMVKHLGMTREGYRRVEVGISSKSDLPLYRLAVERVALAIAAEKRAPMLAPASVRNDAKNLMDAFTGTDERVTLEITGVTRRMSMREALAEIFDIEGKRDHRPFKLTRSNDTVITTYEEAENLFDAM